ncbi:condensation domain-containing protein [Paenibacillus sp. ACRRX]|uniref:condensation domain-containing protein n=1 Tax=unclassified Paenibacillus TaxID=185978 RepID=UPI001EF5E709|nr:MULTISPECIES: condensation domain-containing protein [unclassified Paenibacillus]MCG7409455.1 condensation domain-containing protein [Paenibacillus sp. ACRRX]MDK8180118.1 condensation domain-containing protein [Paenibacillus sp. UMB4589-SE434]
MKEEQEVIIYPAASQDRMNYLMGLFTAVQQIGTVLHFAGQLDTNLLQKALQLTSVKNPILNSRFVEAETPYWEKYTERAIESILSVQNCQDHERDSLIEAYIAQPIDWVNGPMLEARLFRSGHDSLCLKISHLCMDGAGVKEFIQLLATLYTRLFEGESYQTIHQVMMEGKQGFRDQTPLFAAAGITDIWSAHQQQAGIASLWSFPSTSQENLTPVIAVRSLEQYQTEKLINRTKAARATLNDGVLAAYFRSIAKQAVYMAPRTKEKAIGITVDLRRYLPSRTTGALCNLSGMEMPEIEMNDGELFEATLEKVKHAMDAIKKHTPGLSSAAGMEKMAAMPLSTAKAGMAKQHEMVSQLQMALPLMTNFGVISEHTIQFAACNTVNGYMTSPIMYAPFFCLGVSSYRNILTLCVGYHTPAVSEQEVSRLLDDIMMELTT